jgi:diadenylate cyclase
MEAQTALLRALEVVAPGTPLREGMDRILQAKRGALIVVGDGPEVLNMCSGGFMLDAAFTPQRVSELAKMDGAIILSEDAGRIARANVHLVPNPNVPTTETGTRHRTAERVARCVDVPVISASEDMAMISLYLGDQKYPLERTAQVLDRANQALTTLARYRSRLDSLAAALTSLEFEDLVTMRDVVGVLQVSEMVVRIADEVSLLTVQLGVDGRLVRLQLDELISGLEDERRHLVHDYFTEEDGWHLDAAMAALGGIETESLLSVDEVAKGIRLPMGADALDSALQPKGYRMLAKIPRLSPKHIDNLVDQYGSLSKITRASITDLEGVEGVGTARATAIKEGLGRLAEASILDSYS